MRPYELPSLSLVVLVGVSGAGKSTFAARHFKPTEVLSSDRFRGLVADDESDQAASADAFEAMRQLAAIRLRLQSPGLRVRTRVGMSPDAGPDGPAR